MAQPHPGVALRRLVVAVVRGAESVLYGACGRVAALTPADDDDGWEDDDPLAGS